MASVSYQIANLLEKMTSNDKDFRFMATNDLMTELQKDSIKLDDDSERKVVKMLLRLLEDKNGEVQNLAVKCLGPLVNKVKEYQVEGIVETLCANMLSDTEQLRDISSIGLKTVISELPLGSNTLAANVCKKITGRLSSAIEKQEDVSVQLEALDILADLLSRFGGLLISFHPVLLNALLPQLASPRQAVRKRTIVALSHLVMTCSPALYNKLIDHLLEGLGTSTSPGVSRTHIQCIAAVCRVLGVRFGSVLWRVAPPVLTHSRDADEELREHCLQALEAFVLKCPKEIQPHVPTIIELCLKMITYDPNYNYEDSSDGGSDSDMEAERAAEPDSDSDEYSDDDDMSWKVRRAAAKCLESVISTRHELLPEMYQTVSPALIARFKEREENVKCDILSAYTALLRATRPPPALAHAPPPAHSPQAMLLERLGSIVRGALRVVRGRSPRARAAALALLRELLTAAPRSLGPHAQPILKALVPFLTDKTTASSMKIETLVFIVCLARTHEADEMRAHVPLLLPPVLAAVHDPFYKVTAEALRVLQTLVKVMRPLELSHDRLSGPSVVPAMPRELAAPAREMYACVLVRLRATDMDQEVKERAIAAAGQLLAHAGDTLQDELPVCLPIFLERLRNEITRLTTVKALTKIASSPLRIDLTPILPDAVPILGSFLRKNQRALKMATLVLLDTLVQNYSNDISIDLLSKVLMEVPPLVCESDLHCAQTALALVRSSCLYCPHALNNDVRVALTPHILALAKSPLLQGGALKAMVGVLRALVAAGVPGCGRRELLALLVAPVQLQQHAGTAHATKQAFHSLAKCVAAVVVEAGGAEARAAVKQFLQDASEPTSDAAHMFALLAVAEIGKHLDLSTIPHIKDVLLASFTPSSEEVKSAASYALGSVAVGNLPELLPFILSEIDARPRRQYLLLHSLREIISCESCSPAGVAALRPFIPQIWVQLAKHCQCQEEGSRNVVAECLGKLCLLEPEELLPHLQEFLRSPEPLTRTTAVTAVKFTISDQPQAIDPLLRANMAELLLPLRDPALSVRRVALVAFNSAAHNKPSLIRDLLPRLLPTIYNETKVKKELIREVEMGPFKHSVDDGLDLRKAAFECMYTVLDTCLDRLDVFEFLRHVEDGLRDHYDIKMLTYLMCARLAQLCPSLVLQRLESLVEPLRATCTMKVKANSVKQEYEKQEELKRSALRAAAALMQIPEADKNPHLMDFVTQIKSFPELQPIFESMLKDSGAADSNMMDQS
ncbi:cullin-associated NEDD8-dissociated protein 1 isoform X2 [Plutella xylostella]|uniref:cullin-associated NEDD8-dissociated protein 1 isoform X1 n=1 Tax=Plutella xylostella TaxID=51655 RepID=UPI00203288F3|nr:cullin-associated NEDD8-dissociated protein 1 isoform X1 [Plutella xylostella]XP_048489475.1 cullin-associated NEDD8-dissociated protein 1 isoform X2 [Plutella xylostella]